jgi:phytoene dehydrogenase-like protein
MSRAPKTTDAKPQRPAGADVIVIGAGIAGLASALRLSAAGLKVMVLERAPHPGGKMRTVPSPAGPVDTGPTVLTMRAVFEDLFAQAGARLDEHVTLHRQHCLARHFWTDGSQLDLFDDPGENRAAIRAFAGEKAAAQFDAFSSRARTLFEAFDAPMMQAATPSLPSLGLHVALRPWLLPRMAPGKTLAQLLESAFDDPRLAQLFGRYATYVGGSPYGVPALLALIWEAEAAGVWVVEGGMHQLARAIEGLGPRARGGVSLRRRRGRDRGDRWGGHGRDAGRWHPACGQHRAVQWRPEGAGHRPAGRGRGACRAADAGHRAQPLGRGLGLCRNTARPRACPSQRLFPR